MPLFGRAITLFTIFGFRVRVDLSWALLALLVMGSTAQSFMGAEHPVPPAAAWVLGGVMAIGLLFSIVWHELSHSLMARRHGMKIRGITLFMLGGVAELEDEPTTPRGEFRMAIVGPLSSVLLAGLLGGAWFGLGSLGTWPPLVNLIGQLALLNVVLAVFNLVPAFPLDGGRVLRSMLWRAKGDALWATRIASAAGVGFGALFMAAGVALGFVTHDFGFVMWVLIGFFLMRHARAPYKVMLLKARLGPEPVSRFMGRPPEPVSRAIPVGELMARFGNQPHDDLLPVTDGERMVGLVTLAHARRVPRDEWMSRSVGEISVRPVEQLFVTSSMSASEALERMRRTGLSTLLVLDGATIVGTVHAGDLLSFGLHAA
jgi:Zn-dependent protease/CBS domain-containing protein